MKKIYSTILAIATVLSFVPVANAQYKHTYSGIGELTFKGSENDFGDNDEIGVSKQISAPVNGTYWIKLEAFAKGEATKTSTPSDFVLVLDVSGSMSQSMGSQTRLQALKTAVNSFIDEVNKNDTEDMGGNKRDNRLGNRIAIVTFSTDAEVMNELTELGDNINDISGVNDLKRTVRNLSAGGGTYAHKGMEEAYNLMNFNDDTRKLRTVVLFTDGDPGLWANWTSNEHAYKTTENSLYYYNYNTHRLSAYYSHDKLAHTQGRENLTYYNSKGQQSSGTFDYGELRYDTFQTANETIEAANRIKNIGNKDKGIISNVFTVSVITNPSTQTQVYLGKTSSDYVNATSMGSWTDTWHDPIQNSDWEYGGDGKGTKNTEATTDFSLSATTADELKAAFDAIAGISGNPNNTELSSSTSTIDVVSQSFTLSGTTINKNLIKVYTAPYLFNKTTKALEWGAETLAPNSKDQFDYYVFTTEGGTTTKEYKGKKDVDDDIDINASKLSQNVIELTGFDYTNNWCGPIREDGKVAGAQGHKVIILIPIKMDENAVGGPNVVTNADGSGIFVNADDKKPLIEFKSPTVSLPVNLSIKKENLKQGENAKFVIKRAVATEARPDDADATWHPDYSKLDFSEYVTSVVIPNKDGSNEVKIKGLPSTPDNEGAYYVYKIIEEDWSWTYTFSSASGEGYVKTGSGESAKVEVKVIEIEDKFGIYSDMFVKNPITFTNTEESDSDQRVRHAESKVTNTFKPSSTNAQKGIVTTSNSE